MSTGAEHFVTLFDSGFLPQGLALHSSLVDQGEPFILWVVCMDEMAERALEGMALPRIRTIPLRELEDGRPELLDVKRGRSRAEYCWTVTSFTFDAVFRRDPRVSRVTYLDADICFLGPWSIFFRGLDESGAKVLLTEHAFDPRYDQVAEFGRFCVQFLSIVKSESAATILRWWQDRCLEWCFARAEDGKFGDQKYLDDWPERWGAAVTVIEDKHLALAPWNVEQLLRGDRPLGIFHFHGLRIHEGGATKLWERYHIPRRVVREIYRPYLGRLRDAMRSLERARVYPAFPKAPGGWKAILRKVRDVSRRRVGWARVRNGG